MSEINVVKQLPLELTEAESAVMRKVMFQMMDGLNRDDKKAWRKFWTRLVGAEPGEIFSLDFWFPRNGKFHRLHMAMEQRLYDAQERFTSFDAFRDWLKVGAGFCDWLPGPRGGIFPKPKSISYRHADEEVMRRFHADTVAFLRTDPRAAKCLWPHLSVEKRAEMIDTLLEGFD